MLLQSNFNAIFLEWRYEWVLIHKFTTFLELLSIKTWGNSSVIGVYFEIGEQTFLHVNSNFFALGRLSVRANLYHPPPHTPRGGALQELFE